MMLNVQEFLFHFGGKLYAKHNGTHYEKVIPDSIIDENIYNDLPNNTYAAIVSTEYNRTNYIVFDIDSANVHLSEEVSDLLFEYVKTSGFTTTVFFSGRKGFHHYIFLDDLISLHTAKTVGKQIVTSFSNSNEVKNLNGEYSNDELKSLDIEVFPKQSSVDFRSEQYGNHLKLPGSKHPVNGVISQQLSDYVLNSSKKINELESNYFYFTDIPKVIESLIPIWLDGKRHNVTMAVAGFMKMNGISQTIVNSIFYELLNNGGDREDVQRVIDDTYAAKDRVSGLSYCTDINSSIENVLFSFVTSNSPLIKIKNDIVRVRLEKGATFLKVNKVVTYIVQFIKEKYLLYNDGNYFYLCNESTVITDRNKSFNSFIYDLQLNLSDTFSKQVVSSLIHYIFTNSTYYESFLFSKYEDGKVTLQIDNIRSIGVICDGSGVTVSPLTDLVPSLGNKKFTYLETKSNVFLKLLGSFGITKEEVDLLYAWTIAQFLLEKMNSKPVLLISGPPGSGKTTLANVILKVVENTDSKSISYHGKIDKLITSLSNHKMLVMDNVEFLSPEATDFINSIVTGTSIELRKLYTTNDVFHIKPNCSICMTSAFEQFNTDGAFSSRLIRVNVPKRNDYGIESEFYTMLENNYSRIVSEIIDTLKKILPLLQNNQRKFTELRISDFVLICSAIRDVGIIETDLEQMIKGQQTMTLLSNPFYKLIISSLGTKRNEPFMIEDVANRILSQASNLGIKNLSMMNLSHKILSTGMFVRLENGHLQRIINQ